MKKGISLIVLSITILVMAILAATAIIALEDSGIIGRSKNTISKENYDAEYQRLIVIKNGILTDNLGEITVDEYIEELLNKGIVETGFIENLDGSKTVVTKTGFLATIKQDGESNLEISLGAANAKLAITPISISADITNGTVEKTLMLATENVIGDVVWSTSNANVASVTGDNSKATLLLKGIGNAIITASYGNSKSVCTVNVTGVVPDPTITFDKVSISKTIEEGTTATESIIATTLNIVNNLTWTTSNSSVATVSGNNSSATITVKGAGTAVITATGDGVSATCTVSVTVVERRLKVDEVAGQVLSTEKNTNVYDIYGNRIVVPADFKIRVDNTTNYANTVNEGIVIEHGTTGDQFVWIPVGIIYTNVDRTESQDIKFGRYQSWSSSSTALDGPAQKAENYANTVAITTNFVEQVSSTSGNTKARDLAAFCLNSISNGGYYFGRFEAGTSNGTLVCKANQTVYANITQISAASKCRYMYDPNLNYTSDLANSYAYDTALAFIRKCGTKSNSLKYLWTKGYSTTQSSVALTGTSILNETGEKDEQLNIYDIAGNAQEWLTTTSTYNSSGNIMPCVVVGGRYDDKNGQPVDKGKRDTSYSVNTITFRPILYLSK